MTGPGNLTLAPQFVSATDYHLATDSPCIDAAYGPTAPATDLEGTSRYDVTSVTDADDCAGQPDCISYIDMHVHAYHPRPMRTTIEITDAQRAKLLALAADRGMKGFSALVREALDEYLEARGRNVETVAAALATRGSLSAKEADALTAACTTIRDHWR
jgi:Arc/MetJ family transcription regulator